MMTIPAREAAASTDSVDYWTGADGQRELDVCGVPANEALDLLLDQCADEAQREAVLAGTFTLMEA